MTLAYVSLKKIQFFVKAGVAEDAIQHNISNKYRSISLLPLGPELLEIYKMKILVAVKRVIDYSVPIRVKPDKVT